MGIRSTISRVKDRQATILDIISKREVNGQDELYEFLFKLGFATTQATVSRDLTKLKVGKIPTNKGYKYFIPEVQ